MSEWLAFPAGLRQNCTEAIGDFHLKGCVMNVLVYLIPISLLLGGAGLAAFFWTLRSEQYDDPDGNSQRILSDRWDDTPPEE
ncbi:hypothetical protein XMM379_000327 [Aliiroseovarius sp. xm-m-379]|nr:hypothetical protein [Aliiroseovarius sp. xm-d-517]NRP23655.1 hypothetical protein [Aliiroseovarius sp. xm-m-379]NRP29098.1 hypothetical protein [Aliiroseovarius sp. xm-m-314]NRP32454.1 hypothetical protein [Aliiroseovarius sp. xm-a-104]NRP40987.1 hypothetical protein [Aliiroseovarius sp. xm-m-339-2]NRP43823.1 hypothetical protein [Aliiroseovarius sp. xm-m-378]NRP48875.1 hypothetical protein [Aliiroseovarius sp. xm-m-354]NRP61976.1 hypothetical protein [Aliiroseovarius sp. xm-a-151]NRP64